MSSLLLKGSGPEEQTLKTLTNMKAPEILREAAARWLGRMANPTSEVIQASLAKAAVDKSETVAEAAKDALFQLEERISSRQKPNADMLPRLISDLEKSNDDQVDAVLFQLGRAANQLATELSNVKAVLQEKIKAPDTVNLHGYADCLDKILTAEVSQDMLVKYGMPDRDFETAIEKADIAYLSEQIKDRDPAVRRQAAKALQLVGSDEEADVDAVLAPLKDAVVDDAQLVAHAVCQAIAEIARREAMER